MKYRADIDGLRAVAVLSVIWFHYGAALPEFLTLPGGFTGVDVFFVISGFLITQQLYADIQAGRFSILTFYDRRARRILPALLAMLVVVLLCGRWLLMPGDYMSLAASSGAAAFGVSNFYFLFNTGYFDQSAELMPVLHTWSLAVEEQFYVVWPAVMYGLATLRSRGTLAAITAAIVIVGFGTMVAWISFDPKSAFYMVVPRAWELAIGALLVFVPPLTRRAGAIAAPAGLALVIAGFFIASARAFPGPSALLPCIGSALIIWPWSVESRAAKLLGMLRPVGLISYSLYLWHWPVWVFYRIYINSGTPRIREAAALFVVSTLLAVLSYRYVETPFRRSSWRFKHPIVPGIAACAVFFCAASIVYAAKGFPSRTAAANAMRSLPVMWEWPCANKDRTIVPGIAPSADLPPICTFGAPWNDAVGKAVLWGDSNAEHLAPLLEHAAIDHHVSVLLYPLCSAILNGTTVFDSNEAIPNYNGICAERRAAMLAFLRTGAIKTVILSSSWNDLSERLVGRDPLAIFRQGLLETVQALTEAHVSIVIVATLPHWAQDPVSCAMLSAGLLRRQCGESEQYISKAQYEAQNNATIKAMEEVKRQFPDVKLVKPGDALCHGDACLSRFNDEFIYRDRRHLRRNLDPATNDMIARTIHFDKLFD